MEAQSSRPKVTRTTGVHARLQGLGLQTYNDASENCVTRAVFKFEPVIRLYKLELTALFGILERDGLDRKDPMLFDEDLDELLLEFGSLIWPVPGKASREHLREAQKGTLYEVDLIYPRDTTILKDRLRGLILAKRLKPGTDIQALIEKRHRDAQMKVLATSKSASATPVKTTAASITNRPSEVHQSARSATESDSEYSVIGTTIRRRALLDTTSSHVGFKSVELRLYQKTTFVRPDAYGPVIPYGPMFLTPDCTTIDECFKRICEKIGADCSFMVFQLPADMQAVVGGVRVDRLSSDADTIFQRVLEIFRKAKRFPGEPQYRSVEVEVGLEMPGSE